jgi:hypothetical protein
MVREKRPGEDKHERWADDPIEHQRGGEELRVAGNGGNLCVVHACQHRIHHPEKPDGNWQRDRIELHRIQGRSQAGECFSQDNP